MATDDGWIEVRHTLTGLTQRVHPRVASAVPHLVPVTEDAAPQEDLEPVASKPDEKTKERK